MAQVLSYKCNRGKKMCQADGASPSILSQCWISSLLKYYLSVSSICCKSSRQGLSKRHCTSASLLSLILFEWNLLHEGALVQRYSRIYFLACCAWVICGQTFAFCKAQASWSLTRESKRAFSLSLSLPLSPRSLSVSCRESTIVEGAAAALIAS